MQGAFLMLVALVFAGQDSVAQARPARAELGRSVDSQPVNAQPSDSQLIRRALEEWVVATNDGRRLDAASIWAKNLIGWYPGQPDDTFEREMERARRLDGVKPEMRTELTINEIMVSGDLAVVRDTWTFTSQTGTGPTRSSLRGFEVWRKQRDGSWKISRWISAPDPASP
jgi:steroid delta-isomerase